MPWGIGGGGTSGGTAAFVNGGDNRAVLIVIWGGALGFNLDGIEGFLGAIPCGSAEWGNGYDFAVTSDGRRPGCEDERLRAIPRLAIVLAGSDAGPPSSGDDEPLREEDVEGLILL